MRKTFRLMTFALAATFLTFTACNPNDDDENNPSTPQVEQPELSYIFEDVASWTPQSIFAGQELAWEGDTVASFIASRDYYPGLDEYYAATDYGEEIPEHALLFSIPYQVGNHTRNSNFVTDENADEVVAIFTLAGTTNYLGIPIPKAWVSENINISVTNIDMAAKKISATITASMKDYLYIFSYGDYGNPDSKTLTITIKNYPLDNWTEMDMKKIAKLKQAKRA